MLKEGYEDMVNKGSSGRPNVRLAFSVAATALVLSLIIEALTLFGAPGASVLDLGAWGKKRILIVWFLILLVYAACRYFGIISSIRVWLQGLRRDGRAVALRVAYLAGGFVLCGFVAVALAALLSLSALFDLTVALGLFAFAVGGCAFIVFANRKSMASSPERAFVPLGIVMGVLIAVISPVQMIVSWDDLTHYERTVALSYLSSPEYTEADAILFNPPQIGQGDSIHWSFSEQEYRSVLDDLNAHGARYHSSTDGFVSASGSPILQYSVLGYIPGAIGLWLGRLAHLPFVAVFLLGRISNVLFFFTLVYFGVKRLKSQKILVLAFSLLPSVLFFASNYSYDMWVVGWLLFGFLRYLSWLQSPDEKLSAKEILAVLASFVIGLGPKAIYFPIFFLLFFIPRSKFPTRKFATRYRLAVIAAALLVLSTFLLPFVAQGAGGGDVRGGGDVSSAGQVSFVLADPLGYAGILANFLSGYLSVAQSASYTNTFAYLGASSLGGLPLVALIIIAVTDSGSANYPYASWRYRLAALALLCGTSALVASALYVSFTAVGSDTIAGVQGRYLLPLTVPFLALFFNSKMKNENAKGWYNSSVLAVTMTFVLVCVIELNLPVYTA